MGIESKVEHQTVLPIRKQIRAWRRANRKMAWGIRKAEFEVIEEPPELTEDDKRRGYIGIILSYGFGAVYAGVSHRYRWFFSVD